MKRILVLFALFAAAAGYAQTVEKQTFVYAVKQTDTLRLDRYVALTPDSRTKPCLLFVFGGGFVGGEATAGEKRIIARRTRRECFVLLCVILFPDKNAPRCAANFSFWLT